MFFKGTKSVADLTQFLNALSGKPISTILVLLASLLLLVGVLGDALLPGGNNKKIGSRTRFAALTLGVILLLTGVSMNQKFDPRAALKNLYYADIQKSYDRGNVSMFQGNYKEAANVFTAIIKDHPKHAPSWNQLSVALSQLVSDPSYKPIFTDKTGVENLDQGVSVLDINNEALFLDAKYSSAWYNRGHIYYGSKRKEDAWDIHSQFSSISSLSDTLKCFEKALKIDSKWEDANLSDVWADQGFLLLVLRDLPGAKNSYQKALEINPENGIAKQGLDYATELGLKNNKQALPQQN